MAIDYDLASQYVLAAREIQGRCLVQNNFYVAEVLRMPDVVTQIAKEEDENRSVFEIFFYAFFQFGAVFLQILGRKLFYLGYYVFDIIRYFPTEAP